MSTETVAERSETLTFLARDAAAALDRPGLAAAVGTVLHRDVGALGIELVLPSREVVDGWVAIAWWPGAGPSEVVEAATATPVAPPQGRPKMRLLRGHWEVRVPVPVGASVLGQLSVGFPGDAAPDMAMETDFLLAVGCVVGAACSGCDRHAELGARVLQAERQASELRERVAQVGDDAAAIVAVSRAMREVVEQLELVAPHDTAVLLRGEAGTEKEALARHVHACSTRSAGPLELVRCAMLPAEAIERELFGREVGAGECHAGRVEQAHGGTLVLDDVHALPDDAQRKLARLLLEGVVERADGRPPGAVDVRVVATTQEALEERVRQGAFRADLYEALAVFPVLVPPLRERPEDIAELARLKLTQMCERTGRDVLKLTREQLRELCAAPWPGNARALESYVERAVILSTGKPTLQLPPLPTATVSPRGKAPLEAAVALNDSIRQAITAALEATSGKLYGADGAAALLGLPPSTLQSKMQKLGIQRADFEK